MALGLAAGCKQLTKIQNLSDNVGKFTCFLYVEVPKEGQYLSILVLQAQKMIIWLNSYYRLTIESVPKFCATRWTAKVNTLSALIAKYKLIVNKFRPRAVGMPKDMQAHIFVFCQILSFWGLVVAQFIFSQCSCVTKTLQAVNCDLSKAYKDIHVSKEVIANARNETTWNKVWAE